MAPDIVERAGRWWLTAWKVNRAGRGAERAGVGGAGDDRTTPLSRVVTARPTAGARTEDGKPPSSTLRRLILTIDQLRIL